MSGERNMRAAKLALLTRMTDDLATQLRAVETAQGLTANSIPNPSKFTAARADTDNTQRIVKVFGERGQFIDQRNGLYMADCTVLFVYLSGGDLAAAETVLEQYLDAIARVIEGDQTLGGVASTTVLTDTEMGAFEDDRSETRHAIAQGVEIHVHTPVV